MRCKYRNCENAIDSKRKIYCSQSCKRKERRCMDKEGVARNVKYRAKCVEIQPYTPVVAGVGFLGVGDYSRHDDPYAYSIWSSIIYRCYTTVRTKRNEMYSKASVCKEWHNFQNFAKWFYENYIDGYHIDKDKNSNGDKVYCPENCTFISPRENIQIANSREYKFISPEGEVVLIKNLSEFCRKNNLNQSNMSAVHSGKRKSHKGWKI